jgi:hypothetical protein
LMIHEVMLLWVQSPTTATWRKHERVAWVHEEAEPGGSWAQGDERAHQLRHARIALEVQCLRTEELVSPFGFSAVNTTYVDYRVATARRKVSTSAMLEKVVTKVAVV